jgi:hypothetical protein
MRGKSGKGERERERERGFRVKERERARWQPDQFGGLDVLSLENASAESLTDGVEDTPHPYHRPVLHLWSSSSSFFSSTVCVAGVNSLSLSLSLFLSLSLSLQQHKGWFSLKSVLKRR